MQPARKSVALVRRGARAVRRHPGRSGAMIAMLSFIVISQSGGGDRRAPDVVVSGPNAPSVPAVSATPTDTSVLVTSSAFSGDVGDTHDSTRWQVALQSDPTFSSPTVDIATIDSLLSYQGLGLKPLTTDSAYNVRAAHFGGVSGEWSGFGPVTAFTASANTPTVIFHSDWSTCTGSGAGAASCYLDGSKAFPWDNTKGDWEDDAAVTDTVLWPDGVTNALEILHVGTGSNVGVRLGTTQPAGGTLPVFEANTERWWRFYIKVTVPGTDDGAPNSWGWMDDGSVHPLQDGSGGSQTNWEFDISFENQGGSGPVPNDRWRPELEMQGAALLVDRHWSINGWPGDLLYRDSVYRFEFGIRRNASNEYDWVGAYVYNAAGTQLYGPADWQRRSDNNGMDVTDWTPMANVGWERSQQLGSNGFGNPPSGPPTPKTMWYWAGFAICTQKCGAYPIAGVEGL